MATVTTVTSRLYIEAVSAPPRAKPSNYPEPFYSRMLKREKRPLGDLFGLTNFGVNLTRLAAHAMEAAEQSDRLSVPAIAEGTPFFDYLGKWPQDRKLYFCDETGGGAPIADVLRNEAKGDANVKMPIAFLTGPEGGFDQSELDALRRLPFATPVGLGPRILRAETAALAALACWQAFCGDWR